MRRTSAIQLPCEVISLKDSLGADNSDTLLTLRDIYETRTPFDRAQNRSSLGSFVKLRLRPQLMTTDGTEQMERERRLCF